MRESIVGQTGRIFTTIYLEHILVNKCSKDKYAKHILDHQHEYGKKRWNYGNL
jgi:hypothetical protein